MTFKTMNEVDLFIKRLIYLNEGSQGICFLDRNRKLVYKFFGSYFDELDYDYEDLEEKDILKFQNIKSNTFIFPREIICLNDKVIGYITFYRHAKNLYTLNPLTISLDRLIRLLDIALKEIDYVSKCGVRMYDALYNVLLGNKIYIIDTLEYSFHESDYYGNLRNNLIAFNLEIMSFLVDGIFDEVIKSNKTLNDMYNYRGLEVSLINFINEFRNYLSKVLGKNITYLREAKSLQDTDVCKEKLFYDRDDLIRNRVIKLGSND